MKTAILQIVFASLIVAVAVNAQEKYERKSISYVNALWTATPEARKVDRQQVGIILEEVKDKIEMERFDYNPLPEILMSDFVKAANDKDQLTVEELAVLMERYFVPRLTKILEAAQEERAANLLTEADRQSFLATKAKESGVTVAEIEKVMNAAYIYLPVLTGYKREQPNKNSDQYTYKLSGGIIWFHVDMSGAQPRVERLVAKTTESIGYGYDKTAFKAAAGNFARNLQVATQAIPEFLLGTTVSEVLDNGGIAFALGKKEGVKMDHTYLVGDWEIDAAGARKFAPSGWVRVGQVADNRRDRLGLSTAWPVKKAVWASGMQIKEHPQLGIDVAFKPSVYSMSVGKGKIPVLLSSLKLEEEYTGLAIGTDLDFQINLAPAVEVSQLFLLLGFNGALQPGIKFKSDGFTDLTTYTPYVWGVHGGMMKKFYYNQLAASFDAKAGLKYYTVKQDFSLVGEDYTLTVMNHSFGIQFDMGWEYAVTPDVNVGCELGYRFYGISDYWDITLKNPDGDKETLTFTDTSDFPEINHSGVAIGLYIHYSPMALPFDPVNLITGH